MFRSFRNKKKLSLTIKFAILEHNLVRWRQTESAEARRCAFCTRATQRQWYLLHTAQRGTPVQVHIGGDFGGLARPPKTVLQPTVPHPLSQKRRHGDYKRASIHIGHKYAYRGNFNAAYVDNYRRDYHY